MRMRFARQAPRWPAARQRSPAFATTLLEAVPDSVDDAAAAQALAEGVHLGSYQFLKYKGDATASKLAHVVVLGRTNAKVKAALARGAEIASAVRWARDLVNEPAGAKSPEEVAELARQVARRSGLKVKVLTIDQMTRARMGGVLGVGQGSEREPRFVRLAYEPAARSRHSCSSARAWSSTPAVSRSRPRPVWRR